MNQWPTLAKQFAKFGIPGLALFVFLVLFYKFNFSFGSIPPVWAAATAIIFLLLVAGVTVYSLSIGRDSKSSSAFHEYELFKADCGSPAANVAALERIARSTDPRREEYLQKLASEPWLAWVEKHAIHEALDAVRSRREVRNLFDTVKQREWTKIDEMFDSPKDANDRILIEIFKQLKYWRYLNRRNHPAFAEVENGLAYGLVGSLPMSDLKNVLSKLTVNA